MAPSGEAHAGLPVLAAGAPLERAQAAMVLLHGRGATAADILVSLGPVLEAPGWAFLAPEAAGDSWYPLPFTAPLAANQPYLDSALEAVDRCVTRAAEHVTPARVVLLGFSQGACLAIEYAARHPRRYGGVVGLAGGPIGPDQERVPVRGTLEATPVVLACSETDPYIAAERVRTAADLLRRLGGDVTLRLYPGLGHEVSTDEIRLVRGLMAALGREEIGEAAGR